MIQTSTHTNLINTLFILLCAGIFFITSCNTYQENPASNNPNKSVINPVIIKPTVGVTRSIILLKEKNTIVTLLSDCKQDLSDEDNYKFYSASMYFYQIPTITKPFNEQVYEALKDFKLEANLDNFNTLIAYGRCLNIDAFVDKNTTSNSEENIDTAKTALDWLDRIIRKKFDFKYELPF